MDDAFSSSRLEIIDVHCHLGNTDIRNLSEDALLSSMNRNGVGRSVCFPFNGSDAQLIEQSLNILEASHKVDRFIPFLRLNPHTIDDLELHGWLARGFGGLKLHPASQDFVIDDPLLDGLYAACEEKRIPIIFHSYHTDNRCDPLRLLRVAERFPRLNIISGHFFGDQLPVIKVAREYPNLYADTSILPSVARIQDAVQKYEFPRLLFGSDVPYDSQRVALTKIFEADLAKSDERRILSGNARRLLRLD